MIGIDATVLTLFLNPESDSPPDPQTGKPVERVQDKISHLVMSLKKQKETIIIPTPVLAEVLVRTGPKGVGYVNELQKTSVFEMRDFDKLCAIELAYMTAADIKAGVKHGGSDEPWQKIKFDRQIVATCKVAGAHTIYASDKSLSNFARRAGMVVIGVHELLLPPEPLPDPQLAMHGLMAEKELDPNEPDETEIEDDELEEEDGAKSD